MLKVLVSGTIGKGFSAVGAIANEGVYSRLSGPLSPWLTLLAMKYNRAPLPVSRSLEKALVRQGLANDPAEPGDLARRYLFLGDARILLAESRKRPTPISHSFEHAKQVGEKQTHLENGVPNQCRL